MTTATPERTKAGRCPSRTRDVFDQGLAFDLETMNRRRLLRMAGLGVSVAALVACGDSGSGSASTSASGASASTSASATTSASVATSAAGDVTEIPGRDGWSLSG